MRTTVRLAESLLAEAKICAVESGTTLTSLIEEALRETLARRRAPAMSKPVRLRTAKGNGLQPGVDLDDSAAMLELMES